MPDIRGYSLYISLFLVFSTGCSHYQRPGITALNQLQAEDPAKNVIALKMLPQIGSSLNYMESTEIGKAVVEILNRKDHPGRVEALGSFSTVIEELKRHEELCEERIDGLETCYQSWAEHETRLVRKKSREIQVILGNVRDSLHGVAREFGGTGTGLPVQTEVKPDPRLLATLMALTPKISDIYSSWQLTVDLLKSADLQNGEVDSLLANFINYELSQSRKEDFKSKLHYAVYDASDFTRERIFEIADFLERNRLKDLAKTIRPMEFSPEELSSWFFRRQKAFYLNHKKIDERLARSTLANYPVTHQAEIVRRAYAALATSTLPVSMSVDILLVFVFNFEKLNAMLWNLVEALDSRACLRIATAGTVYSGITLERAKKINNLSLLEETFRDAQRHRWLKMAEEKGDPVAAEMVWRFQSYREQRKRDTEKARREQRERLQYQTVKEYEGAE